MKRVMVLETCVDCPYCKKEQDYTADSWELCYRFDCKKTGRVIERYVGWNEK